MTINKVILIGNVGRDPKIIETQFGKQAIISLATNDFFKDADGKLQKTTEWHRIVMKKAFADVAQKNLKKSAEIYLEGKLSYPSIMQEDGSSRKLPTVIVTTGGKLNILKFANGRDSIPENIGNSDNHENYDESYF